MYADVVCPWCYIGEKRLERSLALRPDLDLRRRWRPFRLQPGMPGGGPPWSGFARRKFGGEENTKAAFEHVRTTGAKYGLRFAFDRVVSAPNTVDTQRLILFVAQRGLEWETAEPSSRRASRAAGFNGHEELVTLAAEIELDASKVFAPA